VGASRLDVDRFEWNEGGPTPATTAWLCYDDDALHLLFEVGDHHIAAADRDLNGATYEDSSVELFTDLGVEGRYLNFEANCVGVFKMAWQEDGWQERGIGRDLISRDLADRVAVTTSVAGPTREPRPDDEGWWLAATVPFDAVRAFTGVDVAPEAGTEWGANVYRSGVETVEQKATWNPTPTPEPDYHSPEHFGRFRFG
jgi:hypothetical protein